MAQEAEEDDDAEEAVDERWGLVDEAQVLLKLGVVFGRDGDGGPQEGVVVGEVGEEDS